MSTAGEIAILLSEYDNLKAYIKTLRNTNEALLNVEKNMTNKSDKQKISYLQGQIDAIDIIMNFID